MTDAAGWHGKSIETVRADIEKVMRAIAEPAATIASHLHFVRAFRRVLLSSARYSMDATARQIVNRG